MSSTISLWNAVAPTPVPARSARWLSIGGVILTLLAPKCPMCFAAYASALPLLGVRARIAWAGVRYLELLSLALSLGLVIALSFRRRDPWPPILSVTGAVGVLVYLYVVDAVALVALGAAAMIAGATLNGWACRRKRRTA